MVCSHVVVNSMRRDVRYKYLSFSDDGRRKPKISCQQRFQGGFYNEYFGFNSGKYISFKS